MPLIIDTKYRGIELHMNVETEAAMSMAQLCDAVDLLFEREAQAAGAPADNGDKETARAGKQLRTSRSKRTAADGKEKEAAVEDDSGKGQTDGPAKKEKSL